MRGQDRIHHGGGHEHVVAEELRRRGWRVQPWGQGLFTDETRVALNAIRPVSYWRWIPDLIAVRGDRVVLIDPKSELKRTDNHAVEMSAWQAHLIMRPLGLRVVYVFSDLTCNTPEGLRPFRWVLPDGSGGRVETADGSGTAFVLVRRCDQIPLDQWFGSPTEKVA
jgi:hypothetical protein